MTMDVPVRPGDVLSQPTRARLFSLLSELRGPVGTEVLAEKLEMHPNGVRLHLERLLEAGLVERRQERIARGRPRDVWTVSAEAQPGGDPPTGYAELARWLVRSLAAGGARTEDMEAAGRRIGQGLASEPSAGGRDEQWLFDSLTALGFQPERERVGANRLTYRLRNCPYREAVHERQPLVCALHRGLTNGLLQSADPDTQVVGFEPKDPDQAGCLIRVRGPLVRGAPPSEQPG
jgi:predicted ArsR family transcriptional regulator